MEKAQQKLDFFDSLDGVAEATPFFVMFADKIRTTKVREKRKDMNPIGRR